MPTYDELKELNNNSTWSWDSVNKGWKVTSLKEGYTDKSIFLPAAGVYKDTSLGNVGTDGYYWNSTITAVAGNAMYLYFTTGARSIYQYYIRCSGLSVRPICPKSE